MTESEEVKVRKRRSSQEIKRLVLEFETIEQPAAAINRRPICFEELEKKVFSCESKATNSDRPSDF
jgi:hypothetical protein